LTSPASVEASFEKRGGSIALNAARGRDGQAGLEHATLSTSRSAALRVCKTGEAVTKPVTISMPAICAEIISRLWA
jgi:hypothetical protein